MENKKTIAFREGKKTDLSKHIDAGAACVKNRNTDATTLVLTL